MRGCIVDVASLPLLFSHQGILGPRHNLPLPDLNVDSSERPSRFYQKLCVRHNHSSSNTTEKKQWYFCFYHGTMCECVRRMKRSQGVPLLLRSSKGAQISLSSRGKKAGRLRRCAPARILKRSNNSSGPQDFYH